MDNEMRIVGVVRLGVITSDIAVLYTMKGLPTLAFDAAKQAMDTLINRRGQTARPS